MKEQFIHISSISQLHEMSGFPKPTHPLISVIDVSQWEIPEAYVHVKMTSDLYSIALKDKSCGLQYGRNTYDFDEGVLIFTAPNQVSVINEPQLLGQVQGWMIFFHPDLIRNTSLGKMIDNYHFFSYDVHEALHCSDTEQAMLNDCVDLIRREILERIDHHSQTVIASTLELILNLSKRYYERQFNTRSAQHSDVISQFQSLLKSYFDEGKLTSEGQPTVDFFAQKVHLSANYFSDLLKKETGNNAKDAIQLFLIDKAKTLLLSEESSVSEIAYALGFNYPHYFSRLFKSKTGVTPLEYRAGMEN
ncbi:MAG: helix-turn-helix transcriptional regulator [Fluviicola sp.]|nr:helix-turn-helix transcriptional regulator [Fluviicola sp.]